MHKNVAKALNEMKTKPIGLCLKESDLTEDEQTLLMATILDVAKDNVEIHKREETKAEWAIRMGYKITALETQVDAMAAQLKYEMERQNRLITELMVGLNHFIDLCHKGRFAGSGDGPRLALVKAETTNNRHSLAGQGSYTPLTPARPPLYDRTPNGDEIWKI